MDQDYPYLKPHCLWSNGSNPGFGWHIRWRSIECTRKNIRERLETGTCWPWSYWSGNNNSLCCFIVHYVQERRNGTPINIQETFDDQIIVSGNVVSNSIRNYELERSQERIMAGFLSNAFLHCLSSKRLHTYNTREM